MIRPPIWYSEIVMMRMAEMLPPCAAVMNGQLRLIH